MHTLEFSCTLLTTGLLILDGDLEMEGRDTKTN